MYVNDGQIVRPTPRGLTTCYPLMHDDYQGTHFCLLRLLTCDEERILFLPSHHVGVWAGGCAPEEEKGPGLVKQLLRGPTLVEERNGWISCIFLEVLKHNDPIRSIVGSMALWFRHPNKQREGVTLKMIATNLLVPTCYCYINKGTPHMYVCYLQHKTRDPPHTCTDLSSRTRVGISLSLSLLPCFLPFFAKYYLF